MKTKDDFVFSYNINKKVLNTFEKYQEYLCYKNNTLIIKENNKILEMKIISLLEKIGFSITEVGTYLYTEVIIKIINIITALEETKKTYKDHLKEQEIINIINDTKQELINDLNNLNSNFYLELSNKEINLSLFHSYIKKSIPKKNNDSKNNDDFFCKKVHKKQMSYGNLAYEIAEFVLSNDKELLNEDFEITIPKDKTKTLKLY